jgi:phosphoheptose isomerase
LNGNAPLPTGRAHLEALAGALAGLGADVERVETWGRRLAGVLVGGGRLLAAGNGGSAAQAQHLTSELVGRYRDDRTPFSALALCAEGSSLTAISNDYGADETFARQVRAHGRPGDVLVPLSTSGRSPNVLAAARAARECGMTTWALTGRRPNPLAGICHDAVCVDAPATATVQEVRLILIHLLCAALDCEIGASAALRSERPGETPVVRDLLPGAPCRREGDPADRTHLVAVDEALLDRDLEGRVERPCPDALAPIVDEASRPAAKDAPRPGSFGRP